MERSGVKHCSPLHVSALFFEVVFFERQCAHAELPAPPARASKVWSLGTNGRIRARLGRPRAGPPFFGLISILKVGKSDSHPPRRRQSESHRARAAHTMILAILGTGAATGPLVHALVPRRASKVFFQWKSIQSFVQVIPNKSCTDVRIFLEIFYGTFRGPGSVRRGPAREP